MQRVCLLEFVCLACGSNSGSDLSAAKVSSRRIALVVCWFCAVVAPVVVLMLIVGLGALVFGIGIVVMSLVVGSSHCHCCHRRYRCHCIEGCCNAQVSVVALAVLVVVYTRTYSRSPVGLEYHTSMPFLFKPVPYRNQYETSVSLFFDGYFKVSRVAVVHHKTRLSLLGITQKASQLCNEALRRFLTEKPRAH